jgi:hypothetical protein
MARIIININKKNKHATHVIVLKKITDRTMEPTIILLYSAKKKKANRIDEYSKLYPATNSASASGRSNGALLVSASKTIKSIIITGTISMPIGAGLR